MKWSFKQVVLFLVCSAGNSSLVFSQTNLPTYEFGLHAGMLVYQGDLTPRRLGSFETQKFSIGLHASKIISPILSFRANLQLGTLKGDDAAYENPEFRPQRNFTFTTPVTELTGQMVWNITGSNYAEKGFSGYLFAGAGLSFLKIKRDWSRLNASYFGAGTSKLLEGLAIDSAQRLPRIIPVVPVGAGVKYFLNNNWGVNAETNYRIATTDYLDGFSESANPKNKDNYWGYSIGIIYRTGKKNTLGCPVVKY